MQKKSASIFPLLWIMLFDHTCLNIVFPVLTLLFFDVNSRLFAADTSHAVRSLWYGVCVAIPHVMNILVTPLLSALSDVYGRKKILLIGTLGAFLFTITAAFGIMLGMLSLLLFARFIQGGFSRTNPIAQAIVGDISTVENKVLYMGYLQCAISMGAFLGPLLGGYFANRFLFNEFNFSLPYWIAAGLAAISFLLTILFFQETLPPEKKQSHFRLKDISLLWKNPTIFSVSIILLLSQMSWSLYYQFIPPILKTVLHFNPHELGLFVGLIALWLALATGIGIRIFSRFFTLHQMLMVSIYFIFAGSLASLLFCYWPHWTWIIWIAAVPTAIGDVIAYSCLITLYSNAVNQEEQGKVMGICFIIIASVWALSGVLGGMLMSVYSLLPLIVAPVGILIGIVVARRFIS